MEKIKIGYWDIQPMGIQALVHADGIVIMANNNGEWQWAATEWASACRERGMEINARVKKCVLQNTGKIKHWMGGCKEGQVEETEKFGTIVSAKGKIYTEIKNRLQKANQVHYQTN